MEAGVKKYVNGVSDNEVVFFYKPFAGGTLVRNLTPNLAFCG